MAKINMEVILDSPEENSRKKFVGELNENQISYFDGGFLINIKWAGDYIILTKSNNDYKITIKLQKNQSYGLYEDLKTAMQLKLRVSCEDFAVGDNYVNMFYVIEDLNKISCWINYEVQE